MLNQQRWLAGFMVFLGVCVLATLLLPRYTAPLEAQSDWRQQRDTLLAEFRRTLTTDLKTSFAENLDTLSFIRTADGQPLVRDGGTGDATARAIAFLTTYGALFGITDASSELTPLREVRDATPETVHVRLNQLYRGVPVFGTQLVVHVNSEGITGVNGFFVPDITVGIDPTLSPAEVVRIAVADVKRAYQVNVTQATASLYVYRMGLLEGYTGENLLAYAVEVEGGTGENPVKEQVWVEAHTGVVLNRISMTPSDLYRIVYSPTYDPDNPTMNIVREEGDPPVLPFPNPVDNLYDFSGQTYNFFSNGFDRDSYDGAGIIMRTVYLVNENCPNAYWDGATTNYCPGFDLDDVVAHEWGHAYTQFTHGLIYQYQSGALNESYSDVWGETIDLFNGVDGAGGTNNTDVYPTGQRWLVGEDLSAPAQMALLRNMWDPETHPIGDEDPARVQSPNYYCGSGDGGGVHSNSGVPNHAYAMLVDGKTYNNQTVTDIGFIKATHIYFRAMDVYQIPTTNFPMHANALEASCNDLMGQPLPDFQTGLPSGEVITAADCQQVTAAITATEMRLPPLCDYQPILDPNTPEICSTHQSFFAEDWENGTDGWTFESEGTGDAWPNYNWGTTSDVPEPYTTTAIFAVNEVTGTCAVGGDVSGHFTLTSPEIVIPATNGAYELRFDHYISSELLYDGGNLKYSVDGSAFTVVPSDTFTFNAYNETFDAAPPIGQNTNPLAGEDAFTGTDEGSFEGSWGTSIVDLALLGEPGQTIVLQWDFGNDGCNGVIGWYVDNINAYTCDGTGATPTPSVTPGGPTPTPTPTHTPTGTPTNNRALHLPLIQVAE